MADLTETKVRSIVREELTQLKIFDLPTQVSELRVEIVRLDEKIDHVRTELIGRIEKLDTKLIGRIDHVRTELTGRIDHVRTELIGKIDKLEAKVDGIQNQNDKMFRWMLSFFIAILVSIFGMIGVMFQILMK